MLDFGHFGYPPMIATKLIPVKVFELTDRQEVLQQPIFIADFDILIINTGEIIALDTKEIPSERVIFNGHSCEVIPKRWNVM